FRALGFGELGLFKRLVLFGRDARLLGSSRLLGRFPLLGRFRTLTGKTSLFLGRRLGLFGGRQARLFRGELVELSAREFGVEAIRIGRQEEIPGLAGADALGEFIVTPGSCVRIGCRCWGTYRRNQRHVVAAERTVDERLLLVA